MKSSKKFKLILMILISVLIILVGFIGVYSKVGNSYKNILPEYELASDLKGSTVLEFEVDKSSETIYLDKDGKEVDSNIVTEKNEKEYTKKEVLVNKQENLNKNNYKKAVKIMQERLKFLQADQYRLDLDEKTGKIILTFVDTYPDDIKSIVPMEGKLELVDSNTEDVILNYEDFNSAEATYAALEDGSYVVYINLKLKNFGVEKINNIDKYKTSTSQENTEDSDKENKETVNKLKVMFDNDEIAEVSYDDILLINKTLRIATNKNLTSTSTINSKLNTNTIISKLATMGKMPVIYKLTAEEFVNTANVLNIENIIVFVLGVLSGFAIYCIKYKTKGLLALLSFIANIALFLIIVRLTDVQISLNGLAGMIGLLVLNIILLVNILESIKENDTTFSESIKSAYLKTIDVFVIALIIFVVFSFSAMTLINSMGLLMFWGWVVILLGNLLLTVPMLSAVNKK